MRICGIVCEFNPFHEGHQYLISSAKEAGADSVVCVMSGDFTQRGRPAIFDKWTRAEAAVHRGADLVLELPVTFATGSSQIFSSGAISILEGMGNVTMLAFGSESGDIESLREASDFVKGNLVEIEQSAAEYLKQGMSYPSARAKAISSLGGGIDPAILAEPNNILGLEYLLHLKTLEPFTVKRNDAGYHISGTRIRETLMAERPQVYEKARERMFAALYQAVLVHSGEELEEYSGGQGGLGHKLKKEILGSSSMEDLGERLKSKAFTRTRIDRYLLHILLDIKLGDYDEKGLYIRPLAMNARGREILRGAKKAPERNLPILSDLSKDAKNNPRCKNLLEKEILAGDYYNYLYGLDSYENSDYVRRAFISD